MKRVAILGSTGSIGRNALEVVRKFPQEFQVVALSANANVGELQCQIEEFHPQAVCVSDKDAASRLRRQLNSKVKIFPGPEGFHEIIARQRIDVALLAISGAAALGPLLRAIEAGCDIALANKEALVMAGPLIIDKAKNKKVKIIPVDSEQSAIWQCLEGRDRGCLNKIYLTASGGPLLRARKEDFKRILLKDVLRHPRWKMGKKITVDSATLMNKGLEVLEAMYLFGVGPKEIKVVVHPQAIIHSMVEFIDGIVLAQLSVTDMRIPIQYALSYPKRLPNSAANLDFYKLRCFDFEKPDFKKFPCLQLAYAAAEEGGTAPCVLNAANEVSVGAFMQGGLNFTAIPRVIEKVLARQRNIKHPDLEDIKARDSWAREAARAIIERLN